MFVPSIAYFLALSWHKHGTTSTRIVMMTRGILEKANIKGFAGR
jgi:hypothetical protein